MRADAAHNASISFYTSYKITRTVLAFSVVIPPTIHIYTLTLIDNL